MHYKELYSLIQRQISSKGDCDKDRFEHMPANLREVRLLLKTIIKLNAH